MSAIKNTPAPWRWLSNDTLMGDHGRRPIVLTSRTPMKQRDERGLLVEFDPNSADGRLIAAAPDGFAAAELALAWIDPPGNPIEVFDRMADAFERETGFTHPGRSRPPEMGAQDNNAAQEALREWVGKRHKAVADALRAFVAKARGE